MLGGQAFAGLQVRGAVGGGVPVVGGHGKQLLHGIAGQGQLGGGLSRCARRRTPRPAVSFTSFS